MAGDRGRKSSRAGKAGKAGKECVFCRIARGADAAHVVFEDGPCLAFLDQRPLLRGHVLLMPRAHYETIHDLPDDLASVLFADARLLARAVEIGLGADGSFLAVNTRISQSVMHLHLHVVPRWKGDGLFSPKLIWKRRPYRRGEAERTAAAVRAAAADLSQGGRG